MTLHWIALQFFPFHMFA